VHLLFRNLRGLTVANIILLYSPSSNHVSWFLASIYLMVLGLQSKWHMLYATQTIYASVSLSVVKVEMCVIRVQ